MSRAPPTTLQEAEDLETSLILPHFTVDDAWTLGCLLRKRLISDFTKPCAISITLPGAPPAILFHAATRSGTAPDNSIWIARKTKTVYRFGRSSYYMHLKLEGDEEKFAKKFQLGSTAGEYAIHGGGVPVRVEGVEGVVAVVVVSGLKQEQDHMVVVEGLEKLRAGMGGGKMG